MERRSKRVSTSQWEIALEFLERNPTLVRGYNNSARGREGSQRLWQELARLLNCDGSAIKTPKDWATYFNNFKSKLKKIVADINTDASATGGGPPQAQSMSEIEQRFLAIVGPGFGQGAPNVRVDPFPNMGAEPQGSVLSLLPEIEIQQEMETQEVNILEVPGEINVVTGINNPGPNTSDNIQQDISVPASPPPYIPHRPIRVRRTRYHTRPMAPIDEARRILSQVETQRIAAEAKQAEGLLLIGNNVGRLADAEEQKNVTFTQISHDLQLIINYLRRLADASENRNSP